MIHPLIAADSPMPDYSDCEIIQTSMPPPPPIDNGPFFRDFSPEHARTMLAANKAAHRPDPTPFPSILAAFLELVTRLDTLSVSKK